MFKSKAERYREIQTHCKKGNDFPAPSRDVTNQTLSEGNSLIIPGQGEFGK
jgi:hypothetical protein